VKLLGAVTDAGEAIFADVTDSFTGAVTIRFPNALHDEFGEHLHVVLDNPQYFASQSVQGFVEDSARTVSYLANVPQDMNPGEECWRQFRHHLGNRFFEERTELRPAIWSALDTITPPSIGDYLCHRVSGVLLAFENQGNRVILSGRVNVTP
jgi:hypothetical protein